MKQQKIYCEVCYKTIKKLTEEQQKFSYRRCKECKEADKRLWSCRSCHRYFDKVTEYGFCQQCDGRG